jgi:hypothetical protein
MTGAFLMWVIVEFRRRVVGRRVNRWLGPDADQFKTEITDPVEPSVKLGLVPDYANERGLFRTGLEAHPFQSGPEPLTHAPPYGDLVHRWLHLILRSSPVEVAFTEGR